MTTVTKTTTAGKPADPMLNIGCWRGGRCPGRCPPSEPPASRAAAGALGGPGAPPPDPRSGALTAQRRTVVVTARVPRADQAAFGLAAALRLQNALEPGHKDVSGLGERWLDARVSASRITRRPEPSPADSSTRRAGGFVAFPQGSFAPQARAGSDPGPRK